MTFWRNASLPAIAALSLASACSAEETPMPSQTPKPLATPASTADRVLSIDEISGLWSLRPDMGEGRCRVALNKLPAAGGYGVQIESCTVAAVASGRSWRPVKDGFELLGEQGRVLMRFRRLDVNTFTAEGYRLTPAPMA
jgi:hypothetical protein